MGMDFKSMLFPYKGGRYGMGYKDKKYYKDLHQQAYDKLNAMQAFGESKKEAVLKGIDKKYKIYS